MNETIINTKNHKFIRSILTILLYFKTTGLDFVIKSNI